MDFSGIEIHNPITNTAFTGKGGPLDRYNTQATARALRDKGLSMPALDSSVDISAGEGAGPGRQGPHRPRCRRPAWTRCASSWQHNDDEDAIHAALAPAGPLRRGASGVVLADRVERHLLQHLASWPASWTATPATTWAPCGMSTTSTAQAARPPRPTVKNLGAYVKHVHMRDSDDDGSFNLVGEGTLPIDEVVRALSSIDYDGYVSLEWDARVDARPHRHGGHLPPLRQLHGAASRTPAASAARSTSTTTAPASTCGRKTSSST